MSEMVVTEPAQPVQTELMNVVPEGERATLLPSTNMLERLMFISNAIARSAMPLPKNCRTPESIFAKLLIGWEHGLGPMTSLHEIHIIEGRASLPSAIKVAIVRQRGLGRIDVKTATATECVVEVKRSDWKKGEWKEVRFTWDEAVQAGLTGKDNWRKYPRSMLVARCCDLAVHTYFQEVFTGLPYSPDELGVETDEAGRPLTVEFEKPMAPATPVPAAGPVPQATPTPPPEAPAAPAVPAATPVAPTATATQADPNVTPTAENARALGDRLKIERQHRFDLFGRFDQDLSLYVNHLLTIDELRRVRVHVGVDDFQYGCALDHRGVDRDYLLTTQQAREMIDKLYEHLTPSDRAVFGQAGTQNPPTPASAGPAASAA